jgi:hypothetical protein
MYLHGQGVPQDYVLAQMWFNVSAAQGYQEAIRNRDMTVRGMTPAQIAEAQKLANQGNADAQTISKSAAAQIDPDVPIPGHTAADAGLKRDIVRNLNLLEYGARADCAEPRKVINTEVVELQRRTGTVVERWTVDRCGKLIKYLVQQTSLPKGDPRGRTMLKVTAENF